MNRVTTNDWGKRRRNHGNEYRRLGFVDEVGNAIESQRERIWDYDANRLPFDQFQRAKVTTGAPPDTQDERTYLMIEEQTNSQRDALVRLGYNARPLNGIWATAPYLHNGSVRSLYQFLPPDGPTLPANRNGRFTVVRMFSRHGCV